MTALTSSLVDHYAPENLIAIIKEALAEAGADPDAPSLEALKPVDEFHTGGIEATEALLDPLGITAEMRVLDLGSGIGGTARYIASRFHAHVTGVDLTYGFVETAKTLSEMTGLSTRTTFHEGTILDLPLDANRYDLATMMHVGMNIADKAALFAEVARVLAPGGRFALFDIMKGDGADDVAFPVPWSPTPEASFVDYPYVYRNAAKSAGLTLIHERDRSDYARDYFQRVIAAIDADGVPPVGLHLLMGSEAQTRYGNAVAAAKTYATAPWEMVFQKAEA